MPERVICDSNIHDAVAADGHLKSLIDQCRDCGLIILKTTHVQDTELSKIPDENDIGQKGAINAERIGTAVFVLGYSRLGEDRLGGINAAFAALQKGNPKHTEDAMIGATAFSDADILVTNDSNFRKKFEKLKANTTVMSSAEFGSWLTDLLSR